MASGTKKLTELELYSIFKKVERDWRIPVVYLLALSKGESNWTSDSKTGKHWGLLQASPDVLESYNKATGKTLRSEARLDPEDNAQMVGHHHLERTLQCGVLHGAEYSNKKQ